MPLFLRLQEPQRREKLILGGAVTFRHRRHHFAPPMRRHGKLSHPSMKRTPPPPPPPSTAPKQARRRRGVVAKHRRPLSQKSRRQRSQKRPIKRLNTTSKRNRGSSVMKVATKSGKRLIQQLSRAATSQKTPSASTAKQVLNQLANSRQIQRAVKGVVTQSSDLPAAAGAHMMRQVAAKAAAATTQRQRKRLPDADSDDNDDAVMRKPATKRARLAPGFSTRIGYRNKQILRGGTRQQRGGGAQFLF